MPIDNFEKLQTLFPDADYEKDIILRNDGEGLYIKEWNLPDPKPTETEINAVDATKIKADNKAQRNRVREYPSIREQLDMIYWDQMKGTSDWKNKITDIKTKYPIP